MSAAAQFGMIGLAVMGKNLALNVADHGYSVAVWNLERDQMLKAVAGSSLKPSDSLRELVGALEKPRKIMMMIKAGKPVDSVLKELVPLLEPGDIVIEGGNSWYQDTQRREAELAQKQLHFFGVGVSGGEEGARHGPSLMPGGNRGAYQQIQPILEAIAAKTEAGACVTYVGPGGAGHFVKMVHNGIEYADMQCIAEAYHVLRDMLAAGPEELAQIFERWNKGPLESFLIEITAKIFSVKDGEGGGYLVDKVLDQAGQKGTGRWTAQVALELGISIPSIAASIDARVLSSMKKERVLASSSLQGPRGQTVLEDRARLIKNVHDALLASKILRVRPGNGPDRRGLGSERLGHPARRNGADLERGVHHPCPLSRGDPRRLPRRSEPRQSAPQSEYLRADRELSDRVAQGDCTRHTVGDPDPGDERKRRLLRRLPLGDASPEPHASATRCVRRAYLRADRSAGSRADPYGLAALSRGHEISAMCRIRPGT